MQNVERKFKFAVAKNLLNELNKVIPNNEACMRSLRSIEVQIFREWKKSSSVK